MYGQQSHNHNNRSPLNDITPKLPKSIKKQSIKKMSENGILCTPNQKTRISSLQSEVSSQNKQKNKIMNLHQLI